MLAVKGHEFQFEIRVKYSDLVERLLLVFAVFEVQIREQAIADPGSEITGLKFESLAQLVNWVLGIGSEL